MESAARILLLLALAAVALALLDGGRNHEGGWAGVKHLINQKFATSFKCGKTPC